ncbi:oxysterol-binding protein-related protein 4B-like isoform X2 [Prosopis cineraria]|uniref:oxysterol-binding protein-related protein 4B-like isoform X2 n=1 Tax=Prosopis cineraria TaxID=364024 RepID=UPI00240FF76C|nr:oxysterol-binding protein-related protein 4B-like isoform X2 [Prosopis cineraria]
METEGDNKVRKVILTKPFSLEAEANNDYSAPNLLHRILSLFSHVRPGSDLSHFQLPAAFNFPKSCLQCYGEEIYSTATDLLGKCNGGESPLARFINVVAWAISTTRPLVIGDTPYNPILGETHHVSRSSLHLLAEQVSHHPPVSALHATDEKENIEIIWCHQAIPKFHGTSVEAKVLGKRTLKLMKHGETYEMNSPNLLFRFLPIPGVDWVGNVCIRCKETGLVADLCYKGRSFLGFRASHRSIEGKILDSSSSKVLYDVDGHWDRAVAIKDKNNGKVRVIYDAREVISGLQAPTVKNSESVRATESAMVWGEVSEALMRKEWERATEAKRSVEETQRKLLKERESRRHHWTPKHFTLSLTKEGSWDCFPLHQWVPPAPIIAP